jgi:hypothetical protein
VVGAGGALTAGAAALCGLLLCAAGPWPVLLAEASDPAQAKKTSSTSAAVAATAAKPHVLCINVSSR